jgi:hypothetical protein
VRWKEQTFLQEAEVPHWEKWSRGSHGRQQGAGFKDLNYKGDRNKFIFISCPMADDNNTQVPKILHLVNGTEKPRLLVVRHRVFLGNFAPIPATFLVCLFDVFKTGRPILL